MTAVLQERERAADIHRRRTGVTEEELRSSGLLNDLKIQVREQCQLVKDRYPEMSKTAFKFTVEETFGNIPVLGRPVEYAAGRVADGLYGRIDADERLRVVASHAAEILNKEAVKLGADDARALRSYFDEMVTERLKPELRTDDVERSNKVVEETPERDPRSVSDRLGDALRAGVAETRDELGELRQADETVLGAARDILKETKAGWRGEEQDPPADRDAVEAPVDQPAPVVEPTSPTPPEIAPPPPEPALTMKPPDPSPVPDIGGRAVLDTEPAAAPGDEAPDPGDPGDNKRDPGDL